MQPSIKVALDVEALFDAPEAMDVGHDRSKIVSQRRNLAVESRGQSIQIRMAFAAAPASAVASTPSCRS